MEQKILFYSFCIGVSLVTIQANGAPVQDLTDKELLKRTIGKLDQVLDYLQRRYSDPDKRQSWVDSSNPDGPIPYRSLPDEQKEPSQFRSQSKQGSQQERRDPVGQEPVARQIKFDNFHSDSGHPSNSKLREVLRSLLELEEKRQNLRTDGRWGLNHQQGQRRQYDSSNPDGPMPYRSLKRET